MTTMRAKETGTFDHSTKTWRLRSRKLQVSIRQLSERYGVEIGQSERESATYWRRFLQDKEDNHRAEQKSLSPLQDRIKSIEYLLARCRTEGRPEGDLMRLEGQLTAAIAVPPHDIDHADVPVLHPAVEPAARLLGADDDEYKIRTLNATIPAPPPPSRDTMRYEADEFIRRYKAKKNRTWYGVRQAVELLLQHTGDIPVQTVSVHHWRRFVQAVQDHLTWNDTTRCNMVQTARTFVERIGNDRNWNFGFLKNKDYVLRRPAGQKIQFTIDEVKTALHHATGEVRFALLLGLNAGSYWSDIGTLTADMLQGDYLVRSRAKLAHKSDAVVGRWRLWAETRACLRVGLTARTVQEKYMAFARQYKLPSHKALRKTTTQLIEDHVGEREARLFRGEGGGDTHGRNYVRQYTPEQVAKLDHALQVVAKLYGVTS